MRVVYRSGVIRKRLIGGLLGAVTFGLLHGSPAALAARNSPEIAISPLPVPLPSPIASLLPTLPPIGILQSPGVPGAVVPSPLPPSPTALPAAAPSPNAAAPA